jgi:peptidoglycan/xylan/chitin deacetylase (PgdA/CDA1 family)
MTIEQSRARRRAANRRRSRRRRRGLAGAVLVALVAVAAVSIVPGLSSSRGSAPRPERPAGRATRSAVEPGRSAPPAPPPRIAPAGTAGRRLRARDRRERRVIERVLAFTPFVARGTPRRREVALTFDDGPGPYTRQIVRILRREHAAATFFVVGEQVADFATSMAAARRAGFPVGDHTQTHPRLPDLSLARQYREIADQQQVVRGAGVREARLFRPPFGVYDRRTLAILRRKSMLMVLWSVDTSDYTLPGVRAIVRSALRGAKPGAIILMHDGGGDRSQTVRALPGVIRGLRKRRLRLVTVPRLVLEDPPPRDQRLPSTGTGG